MNLYHAVLTKQLKQLNPDITDICPSLISDPIANQSWGLGVCADNKDNNKSSKSTKEKLLTYLEDKWITPIDILNNLYSTKRQILIEKITGIALVLTSLSMTLLCAYTIYRHYH